MYRRSALISALAIAGFALFHSLLASLPVKRRVRALAGPRRSDGLYRFAFNGIAVVTLAALVRAIWELPDRTLYRLQGIPKWLLIAGQLLCAAALIDTNRRNEFGRVTGIKHAYQFITGREIERPPVAQHPLPDGEALEGWGGPFRLSSHPNNYFVLLLYWLSPVMTVKWAAIGLVTFAYMILGSMHEDARLTHAYGDAYTRYRQRVPHLILFPIDHWRR